MERLEFSQTKATAFKVAKNWKLVQVSGEEKVAICCYSPDGATRIWETTPVAKVVRQDQSNGSFAKTESGTIYFLADSEKHQSLWELGLLTKRPVVHQTLVDLGILK